MHDPDDVVPGRICGRPLPCRDHEPEAYAAARKGRSGTTIPRARRREMGQVELSIWLSREASEALERLRSARGESKTEIVEGLLLRSAARIGAGERE